jgi:putative intracellular protease/amidase
MVAANKILVIVTNVGQFEKVGFRTGLWLGELTHFWKVAEEAGYDMDIASPSGGHVPLDPESLIFTGMRDALGLKDDLIRRYEDREFMNRLDTTLPVSDVEAAAYDAIYMTGGHGVMFDFPTSDALARLTAEFYESDKVVAAVCHGPCGLLNVKLSTGDYLVAGKDVTGFSWNEEVLAKRAHAVPFNLEEELKKRGARYSKARVPFKAHVVEDGHLITGQNPRSPGPVGEAVLKMLEDMKR